MLQQKPDTQVSLPDRARRLPWALAGTRRDGRGMDDFRRRLARPRVPRDLGDHLGGHHLVVLWLAVVGFAVLAVLAR